MLAYYTDTKPDIDVIDFAVLISMLPIDTPLSNEYDRLHGQKFNMWWSCQRELLTAWALHYPFGGAKNYRHEPSRSTRTLYYNFARPETLLWLAEALGEDKNILTSIINEISVEDNKRTACSIIRQSIPFERIIELIDHNL